MADAHLDDDVLLRVAEGEGDPAGRAHVDACPRCADLVRAYRAASATVTRASVPSRAWCPPRESLLAFLDEAAPPLRTHVAACPACRDDVRDLRALALEPEAEPASVTTIAAAVRARVVLALDAVARGLRLLESTLPLGPEPVPVVARGGGASTPTSSAPLVVVAPFGGGDLEVTWAVTRDGVDLRTRARGGAPLAYRVALSIGHQGSPDELWESRSADERGQVSLAGLEPGRYVLAVFGPQHRDPDLVLEVDLRA